ncbi:hypothetical protein [Paenibacillus sp. CF384]|uniref:hypothetical protein n=1 Tax=Paenibacillus sp. CF384 TaxID=1884382 RepID=UPI00089838F3|nr:hypothetical protein [Paenibacillus sp. CF384]SDX62388.1 hypothetical protein SAMN05518855_1017103 [Paenibacillus sp. CF384]
MNKIIVALLLLLVCLTGCKNEESSPISLADVKEVFGHYGIFLVPTKDGSPQAVFSRTYNGVTPSRFVVDTKQSISIYVYPSEAEAVKGIKDFEEQTATADVVPHTRYPINNVVLYDITNLKPNRDCIAKVIQDLRGYAAVSNPQVDLSEAGKMKYREIAWATVEEEQRKHVIGRSTDAEVTTIIMNNQWLVPNKDRAKLRYHKLVTVTFNTDQDGLLGPIVVVINPANDEVEGGYARF